MVVTSLLLAPHQAEGGEEADPIAVITLDGSIEDVTAKLATIQADHPGAQIRKGKRNRWEVWPPAQSPEP